MTSFRNIIVLTVLSAVMAFTPSIPSLQHQRTLSSSPLFGLAPPEVITKTKTVEKVVQKSKQKQKEKVKVYQGDADTETEEAPLWMLFLIGDKGYKQPHVTARVMQIIEGVNEKGAMAIYDAAQKNGEAMCGKFPHETAEFYMEQLTRSDPIIYAEIREDKQDK
jgi:ATP-dependent Clp protease adapter protein ClpS